MKELALIFCLMGAAVAPLRAGDPKTEQAALLTKKESYQKQVENDLDGLSKKIHDLRQKSENAGAETRAKLERQVETLEKELGVTRTRLDELKGQTADGWERFRTGLDKAVADLQKSYKKAASRIWGTP